MKKQVLFLGICLAVSVLAHAAVKRVGFTTMGSVPGVDYPTISAAVTASSPGDTIYLYPTVTENITLDKKLVFIGPGYLNVVGSGSYPPNANVSLLDGTGTIKVELGAGSDSSMFAGITNLHLYPATGYTSKAIVADRCRDLYAYLSFTEGWTLSRSFYVRAIAKGTNDTVLNLTQCKTA